MKKLSIAFLTLAIILVGLYFAADYYRADLYARAIEYEATDARLTHQVSSYGQDSKHRSKNNQDLQSKYGLSDQVEFVKNVTKRLGIEKFHLAGNSMGGAISVLYAATYPDQVLSATLISPAGVHDIRSKMDIILAEGGNPLIVSSPDDFPDLLDFVMEDGPYIPDALIKYRGEIAASRFDINTKIFSDFMGSETGKDAEEKMSKITAPVLFIWGDKDRAINVKNIDKYARLIRNSEKLVLENIGHLAMLEAPEISAKATLRFLELD